MWWPMMNFLFWWQLVISWIFAVLLYHCFHCGQFYKLTFFLIYRTCWWKNLICCCNLVSHQLLNYPIGHNFTKCVFIVKLSYNKSWIISHLIISHEYKPIFQKAQSSRKWVSAALFLNFVTKLHMTLYLIFYHLLLMYQLLN